MFPVNGSLRMAPLFPRSGPGESGSPTSQVLLRCYDFPSRMAGHLFALLPGSARSSSLRVSQLALPVGRRGTSGPGSLFNRRPDLPVCSHADVSGISQVSRQSIPCLCPALATPAEPTIPRLLDGFVDAVPALPTAKTSAVSEFRGSVTRLWHPLPTLQESCCHHPCKARFRLAGLAFTGRASNPLDRCKRFQIIHPPFLDLAWRKGSFISIPPSLVCLFDHLVGAGEHRRWDCETERLGSF
jgi:hypothetical protein